MEITHLGLRSIEVTMERKLVVGKEVLMIPSYGYLGITQAKAEIKEIVLKDSVDQSKYKDLIRAGEDYLEYLEDVPMGRVEDTEWVIYEYVEGDEVGEVYAIPLAIFVDHSHPKF